MDFNTGVHHSPRSQHLNKPLSFCTSNSIMGLAFTAASSWTCDLVSVFGDSPGTVRTLVSPGGPEQGSQLPVAGWPQEWDSAGAENFSGNFPALLVKVSYTWKTCLVKENSFLGSRETPRLGKLNYCAYWRSSIPASWTSRYLEFMPYGLYATWVWLGPFGAPVGRLFMTIELHATWALCHLGRVRIICSTG